MGRKSPISAVDLRPEYQRLGGWIRAKRVEHGLSQRELAEAVGKPEMYVSKIERGRQRIDVVEFMDLALLLRLDLSATMLELRDVLSGKALSVK